MLTPQLGEALFRSLFTAFASGATAAFAAARAGGDDTAAWVAGGTAAAASLLVRGAGEGLYDSKREKNGEVKDSDVGSKAADNDKAAPGNDFEGDVIPLNRELWAEDGSNWVRVVGMRTNRKSNKIQYLIQPKGTGEPRFAERVDRTDVRPPADH